MRLQISFILLLITAATATSIIWRDFAAAREGDPLPRLLVFALAPVALVTVLLLGRIVMKVKSTPDRGKGR